MNNRYIALLRGINVSGQKKILMADLRSLLTKSGYKNVETYIQSGNIIFDSSEAEKTILENQISQLIKETYGYDVPVLVVDSEYLKTVIENNPFLKEDPALDITRIGVTFLADYPNDESESILEGINYPPDKFLLGKKEIYLYLPNGFGRTKLTNTFFEKKLKIKATSRNWKTVNKLFEVSKRE